MLNDYKYSVISKTYITLFFHFLPLPTSNVRMSEGTFCRVEVHIRRSIFITWFDQGGGVPCKYLTVRVDTTHWFIVRIMNRVKQMLFHSYL